VVESSSGRFSPKSLSELACEALCRNLPYLEGDLPKGLPQDVVDNIYKSLIRNSALNSTTLKVFRNCEVGTIEFSNCRGVNDEWLEHLSPLQNETNALCKRLSFPSVAIMQRDFDSTQQLDCDMDIDANVDSLSQMDPFFNTFVNKQQQQDMKLQINESLSWSTSSFYSATSNQQHCPDLATTYYADREKIQNDKLEEERRPSMDETEVSDDSSNHKRLHSDSAQCLAASTTRGARNILAKTYCSPSNLNPLEPHFCATANTRVLDFRGCQSLSDRGLLLLTDLSCLQEAYLDECHSMLGRGLAAFSQAHNLHIVSLRHCRRLTDEGILHLSNNNHCLGTLILEGCRCLTDRSFIAIATMSNLVSLDASQCDLLTDDGFARLTELKVLASLNLGWCRKITDRGLDKFTLQHERRDNLVELILARCTSISDTGIEYLSRLSSLERLDVNGCTKISGTALGNTLQHLGKLRALNTSYIPGVL
jgi:hypothetical protein